MNITSDPNLWAICILVFLLGLLIGVFLTAGGRRKWKARYRSEADRREALEREHADREKEWRERDSLRNAAIKDRDRDDRPM
jgi:beta-lactamase regulating signal transducer with metallopeptidase domain